MSTVTDEQSTPPQGEQSATPTAPQPNPQDGAPQGVQPTIFVTAPPAPKRSLAVPIIAAALVGALTGGVVGGVAGAGVSTLLLRETAAPGPSFEGPGTVTINNPGEVNEVTAIAAVAAPSIVTIAASGTTASGAGSGIVLSADGYVLTNTHVVTLEGATRDAKLEVTTVDGRIFAAEIVGLDPITDLAVIRLERVSDLVPIEWASSSDLNVGDRAVVIGAPLGLSNSVSDGIVSALNRSISIASSAIPEQVDGSAEEPEFGFDFPGATRQPSAQGTIVIPVIQTDAAVNPGNSGGGLVDDEGRLIGVIVAIASTGGGSGPGGSIGVGFAIPSDVAQRIATELVETGTATHGLLGLTSKSATSEDGLLGAVVQEVISGSPAAAAGLKVGDVITGVGSLPVTSSTDLTAQIRSLAAGTETTISYVRAGTASTVAVTLGTLQ